VLIGTLCLVVGRHASATTWPICPGNSITLGTSNGKYQHPEIAYSFWESVANPAFSNGTNSPSRTQWIGAMLSMVDNGQYWAELEQYGTYGGANGAISPPRLAPYAALYQGSINGHNVGAGTFNENDIRTFINQTIGAGYFPHPQSNDNMIYMIITPQNSQIADCAGHETYCCNWGSSYTDGTPYTATVCEDTAGAAHELIEAIAGYELRGGNGNGQIADPCGCDVENVNNVSVAAYYSARLNTGSSPKPCVVPESWGPLYESTLGNGGWFSPSGSFSMRQGYAGSGGVVATDATEHGSSGNNVHFYNAINGTWTQFGQGGSKFAAGGGIIAGITMDPKWGINYYTISNGHWTGIGGPNGGPVTDVTVTKNGIIVATDVDANPWYYNPSNPGWNQIAGPGDQFIASGTEVLALNPYHGDIFYWTGPGSGFSLIGSTTTTQIISSPDTNYWGTTYPGSNVVYDNQGGFPGANFGTGSQYVVTNTSYAAFSFLTPTIYVYSCYGTGCVNQGNDYYTGGYGGWLMGGGDLYVTGCSSGVAPCVND
jgi:hypothetical protein